MNRISIPIRNGMNTYKTVTKRVREFVQSAHLNDDANSLPASIRHIVMEFEYNTIRKGYRQVETSNIRILYPPIQLDDGTTVNHPLMIISGRFYYLGKRMTKDDTLKWEMEDTGKFNIKQALHPDIVKVAEIPSD